MTIRQLIHTASLTGVIVFMTAASANATIIYTTNASGTGFGGTSLFLNQSSGLAATLTFIPNASSTSGVPSIIDLGNFTLVCPSCTVGAGAIFNPFTFNLVITDVTDNNATGTFIGSSSGGSIDSDQSPILINWVPAQLGPGTTNATSGNFGQTFFTVFTPTPIVAPNSGQIHGQTTVQGFVNSTAVPEPATLSLIGGALLGLGLLRRRKLSRS